jgi:hypothetical protein
MSEQNTSTDSVRLKQLKKQQHTMHPEWIVMTSLYIRSTALCLVFLLGCVFQEEGARHQLEEQDVAQRAIHVKENWPKLSAGMNFNQVNALIGPIRASKWSENIGPGGVVMSLTMDFGQAGASSTSIKDY